MTEALDQADLVQMIERDEASADGITTPDHLVFEDRHRLIIEVQRLRALLERTP